MILISTTNQTHSIALGQRLTLRTVVKMKAAVKLFCFQKPDQLGVRSDRRRRRLWRTQLEPRIRR